MKRRTIYVILGIIAAAAIGGVVLWRSGVLQESEEEPLRSTVVERGSMIVAVTAAGNIDPAARVGLTFQAPGRVAEIVVEEGDRVGASDALARLVTDDLELQVEQAEAGLSAAEAQLAQLRSGPRPKEIEQARANVESAEAQWQAAVANRNRVADGPTEAELESAEAQVVQARTGVEIAQDTYDLIEEEGTEKEQANYDLFVAKQELAAAEARLEDVRAGASRDELRAAAANAAAARARQDAAQAQLDQLLVGAKEADISEAEARVRQARVSLELARHNLENGTMRAPFDGIVTQINMTAGETPPTREQPLVLLDNSRFHITVSVDELDVSQLEKGQEVEIGIEALPGADVTGTVESISPMATPGAGVVAYDVVINLDPTEAPLRADMTANVTIIVEELEDVLQIPSWAVRLDRETGETYVHRRRGEEIERVDVTLGARYEGVVQVVDGLSAGDEIVRLGDSSSLSFGPR